MMGVACSGVTKRGVFSTKMKPSASAPASTAGIASRRFVMPQSLTPTRSKWEGDTPPPFPPRLARSGSERPQPPGLARADLELPFPPRLARSDSERPQPPGFARPDLELPFPPRIARSESTRPKPPRLVRGGSVRPQHHPPRQLDSH